MNLLALDTSTDTFSIAVQKGQANWQSSGPGGAQSSAQLIPAIKALMAQAGLGFSELQAIAFGRGPGSFTGLRTACAVAQGLAFAARIPVLPVDSLLAVAEQARAQHGCEALVAVLDARMNEVYHAAFHWRQGKWSSMADFGLCAPEALDLPTGTVVAGNAQAAYGSRLAPQARHLQALPTAEAMLRLAPALLAQGLAVPADQALPHYIRDKVAQTTAERAAARQAAAA
ncbi:tRNA (adenosine(37)-N6)-threonylcarbamoyltransferase complex dimerization subunit type 1 TsaB [Comamonas composti]|uniref:tRNA (adenosine(37)-N6)-threonylcarbamoyltransferase complex dimerization subunit type 1 TsaB n=1 Tax=Comamonas composti TaxID=408558 RepID=UPI0004249D79|nr:tRNA (adenosine(37)-N6)-threonylcarbamoyltransferase complex dimerization subunit type 1 TsaB [Comamonas composti]